LAKTTEFFIMDLTLRSWLYTQENKRRTIQRNDVVAAVTANEAFDFLIDIIPRDESMRRFDAENMPMGPRGMTYLNPDGPMITSSPVPLPTSGLDPSAHLATAMEKLSSHRVGFPINNPVDMYGNVNYMGGYYYAS
jgi:hypothetical protein